MYLTTKAERMLGQPERIAKSLTIHVFIGLLKREIWSLATCSAPYTTKACAIVWYRF